MATYAVLGSTGNCGTALIQCLLQRPDVNINAYCRSKAKLVRLIPKVQDNKRVKIFEGSIHDGEVLIPCQSLAYATKRMNRPTFDYATYFLETQCGRQR